ncbi:NADH-quinone oxidoreductase subunit NuoN [Nonomuraea sp. LP-02]|uniref:NADH-quinone oxidoreductase subunit NuoN n=1 Tax=Nonomuraea sp. LP-02 TaxID=3097960 RepID=UPI002E3078DA|nr:NADH-quinone oxidoreductase subunit NuoN [Nonomuraea sp. LP-02]MED7928187.1 NADH-quinone oxidoreductase subunit NuoN [Nonomuraea sp. LP-02]
MNPAIDAPTIEYGTLAPLLIVFGAAIIGVLVEAFAPRYLRKSIHVPLTLLSLAGAFALVLVQVLRGQVSTAPSAMGALAVDGPSLFLWGVILVLSFVCVLLINDEGHFVASAASVPGSSDEEAAESVDNGSGHTEVYPLVLFAVGGMLLFPAAHDLLMMFVALEVMSLPLYLLCGLARRRRLLSQEASMKYFLLGAFSSAFFLYGTAMVYGFAGTVSLPGINQALSAASGLDPLLMIGLAMLGVGLLFKIGAAPFQAWKPDVYQGAPTPITALMASGTLVAAVGAVLRVFWVGLGNLDWEWRPVIWVVAALTMIVGSVLAITQTEIKRMLAYSSIAHAGFLLIGVMATFGTAEQNAVSLKAILFYLAVYGVTTVGAFAVVTLIRDPGGEAGHLSRWAGLGKRAPVLAGTFAFFLLAFAGIPLTSGFMGKYAVFTAALNSGTQPGDPIGGWMAGLVVVGVIASAVAAFFYVRVIVLMFFSEPAADGPAIAVPSMGTVAVIAVSLLVTVGVGLYPESVLGIANDAASSLFIR